MLARNEITEYLTNQIKPYLIPLVHEGAIEAENLPKYLKLVDNICDFFEEKNYNANKPIRFIYRYLTSTTERGVTYCPIQLIVEAADLYSDEVAQALFNWYYNNDYSNNGETLSAIAVYKLKESLTSPVDISNFSDDGLENYTSFSIEIGLTLFESAVLLTQYDVFIDTHNDEDYEPIKNILSVSKSVIRSKDSVVLGQGKKKVVERDNSYQIRLSLTYILANNNELHKWIDDNADAETIDPFGVMYLNGLSHEEMREDAEGNEYQETVREFKTYKMNILSYTTQSVLTDVTKCELTLCLDGE